MSCHIHQWKKRSCTSSGSGQTTMLVGQQIEATELDFTHVYYISWQTSLITSSNPRLFFEAEVLSVGFELRIVNKTTNTNISTMSVTASGFYTMDFTPPSANARLEIQIRRLGPGANPSIYGLGLVVN